MSQQSDVPGLTTPRGGSSQGWYAEHKVATAVTAIVGLLAIVTIVFAIVVGLSKGDDVAGAAPSASSVSGVGASTSSSAAASPSTSVTPTPAATSRPSVLATTKSPATTTPATPPKVTPKPVRSVRYAGRGSGSFTVKKPQSGVAAVMTVNGSKTGAITVTALDAAGQSGALLVAGGTGYRGSVLLDPNGGDTTRLRVQAPGFWSVVLKPILAAERIQSVPVTGRGDDVLTYVGDPSALNIVHSGSRTFTVNFFGATSKRLVNTTGRYNGQVVVPGSGVLAIRADGKWSIGKP